MKSYDILTATFTDKGGRGNNEDYVGYKQTDNLICWVLADGLGGHGGGEVASKLAVETILNEFLKNPRFNKETIEMYINKANQEIIKKQKSNPELSQMKTTIVVLMSDYENVIWGHVGDSRLYHFRDQEYERTKDHSMPQVLYDSGEITEDEIRTHSDRGKLIRALGNDLELNVSLREPKQLKKGDSFLLATDGFWELIIEDEMIIDSLKSINAKEWLDFMAVRIMNKLQNKDDNFSGITVMIK